MCRLIAPEHPFDNGDMRLRDEVLADFPRTEGEVRQHIADYYGMIEHMDAKIGQVLAARKASGRAGDTMVVYTADHGLAVETARADGQANMLRAQRVGAAGRAREGRALRSRGRCAEPDLRYLSDAVRLGRH